jgi:hypothetical protein
LRLPEFAFAGEQAVAKDWFEGAVISGLQEIRAVLYQDLFDSVWVNHQANRDVEEAEEDHVAVLARASRQEAAPVLTEGKRVPEQIQATRAGGQAWFQPYCCVCVRHEAAIIPALRRGN